MTRVLNLLTRAFNFCASIFGPDRVYAHWQNLNEDRDGNVEGWPHHGRVWIRAGQRLSFRFSWSLWSHFCDAYVHVDPGEASVGASLAMPPFSFWWGIEGLPYRWFKRWRETMEFGVRIHDYAIWWRLWSPLDSWSSKTPRWRDGNWHVPDTLLGRQVHSSVTRSEHDVLVPMPEGAYAGKLKLALDTWKRPRWFASRLYRGNLDVEDGIPHEGKGENSWDCGEDATYGISTIASTPEEAIAALVKSVLRDRRRYGGNEVGAYPAPSVRHAARLARKEAKARMAGCPILGCPIVGEHSHEIGGPCEVAR